ncbi:MAG: DUF1501 domain-containing protein [Chthoniobacterales bacterium]
MSKRHHQSRRNSCNICQADELTRRHFMGLAARSMLGVRVLPILGGMTSLLSAAHGAQQTGAGAKASSVIYLFMSGGMSHLDTFDPKPSRDEVMGPTTALGSKADGIQVSNYLPNTAGVMDKVCVVNSMTSVNGAHEHGQYILHTSYAKRGTIQHPSLGAWVLKLGGKQSADLPGFVAINTGAEISGGGFFGPTFGAAPVGDPQQGLQDSKPPAHVDESDFSRRVDLADRLNRSFHERFPHRDVEAYRSLYQEAVQLMKSEDLKAFDVASESDATKQLYGTTRFGQGCLLARRLVEHGVRFVEVTLGGWDTHYDNFAGVEARCNDFDQAYAALINDLAAKGLLDKTLVVVGTEFGRTPEIDQQNQAGRGHHPAAFSCLLAGGGVKGGFKYGETDGTGNKVRKDPVEIADFNATIAHALGLKLDEKLQSPSGRPFTIADQGKPVLDVFA